MSEPAFDVLRTKEQLGYIVYASKKRFAMNHLAISIVVQSSHKDAVYLDQRIEAFLESYREELASMPAETLAAFIQSVIEKLLEKPKNLSNETSAYKEEITNKTYLFDRKAKLVEKLRDPALINHAAVLKFFDESAGKGKHRRKFSTQFFGKHYSMPTEVPEGAVLVKDPAAFKASMALLPVQTYEP